MICNFTGWIGGFVSGMLFIGFGEIIDLLHRINHKMNTSKSRVTTKMETKLDDTKIEDESKLEVNWSLSSDDKDKIYKLYSPDKIIETIPTPFENYCLVKLKSNDVKVVNISGFNAVETNKPNILNKIKNWDETENSTIKKDTNNIIDVPQQFE